MDVYSMKEHKDILFLYNKSGLNKQAEAEKFSVESFIDLLTQEKELTKENDERVHIRSIDNIDVFEWKEWRDDKNKKESLDDYKIVVFFTYHQDSTRTVIMSEPKGQENKSLDISELQNLIFDGHLKKEPRKYENFPLHHTIFILDDNAEMGNIMDVPKQEKRRVSDLKLGLAIFLLLPDYLKSHPSKSFSSAYENCMKEVIQWGIALKHFSDNKPSPSISSFRSIKETLEDIFKSFIENIKTSISDFTEAFADDYLVLLSSGSAVTPSSANSITESLFAIFESKASAIQKKISRIITRSVSKELEIIGGVNIELPKDSDTAVFFNKPIEDVKCISKRIHTCIPEAIEKTRLTELTIWEMSGSFDKILSLLEQNIVDKFSNLIEETIGTKSLTDNDSLSYSYNLLSAFLEEEKLERVRSLIADRITTLIAEEIMRSKDSIVSEILSNIREIFENQLKNEIYETSIVAPTEVRRGNEFDIRVTLFYKDNKVTIIEKKQDDYKINLIDFKSEKEKSLPLRLVFKEPKNNKDVLTGFIDEQEGSKKVKINEKTEVLFKAKVPEDYKYDKVLTTFTIEKARSNFFPEFNFYINICKEGKTETDKDDNLIEDLTDYFYFSRQISEKDKKKHIKDFISKLRKKNRPCDVVRAIIDEAGRPIDVEGKGRSFFINPYYTVRNSKKLCEILRDGKIYNIESKSNEAWNRILRVSNLHKSILDNTEINEKQYRDREELRKLRWVFPGMK